eukprot:13762365-Alexandrium_andersonii.AAC.1
MQEAAGDRWNLLETAGSVDSHSSLPIGSPGRGLHVVLRSRHPSRPIHPQTPPRAPQAMRALSTASSVGARKLCGRMSH